MWRFLLGVGLLLGLLALGLSVTMFARTIYDPVTQALEAAENAALEGGLREAMDYARSARQLWDNRWHRTAAFTDHGPMDEIDSLFSQLEACGKSGQGGNMAALCARVHQLICAISEAQLPTWWNFL